MPFIPHTENDIATMLDAIGVDSIETLFDEIPAHLRARGLQHVPSGLTEVEMARVMREKAAADKNDLCFIGAGAYEHHIPFAVWDIASRGEFMTAYTPYQAEASQGTLQLLYEYQTMMAHLMGLDVSNASLYDGASAVAESILMAVRANRNNTSKNVLFLGTIHPYYKRVIQSIVSHQGINLIEIPFSSKQGRVEANQLDQFAKESPVALIIQQPNFFGVIEEIDQLTDWAHAQNAFVIAVVNPTATAVLKEPGKWGQKGADIACGEGQPLGVPLASGGPYFGFMCCKQELVRHMPGRIIGRTVDRDGKPGFTLTLQAREQHIRRAKATSNICTNQGLLVTAATIYMSLLGFEGLRSVALQSHQNTKKLLEKCLSVKGVEQVFHTPFFHEIVLRMPISASIVLEEMAAQGIQAGFDLSEEYPAFSNCLLICATETKSEQDLEKFVQVLKSIMNKHNSGAGNHLSTNALV